MQNNIQDELINILFIADIVGQAGLNAVESLIENIKFDNKIHVTIANGENAAGGKGLRPKDADMLFDLGVDVITSGNHIWSKNKIFDYFETHPALLRPANYSSRNAGQGSYILQLADGLKIGIINLQGRSFLYPIECPFQCAENILKQFEEEQVKIIFIDFHAEATAEKIALAWYLDGRISALIGTHTHVQTADERILTRGTGFLTDAGMTGPQDSVIGMDKQTAIKRFLTQTPEYYKVATDDVIFSGAIINIDQKDGRTKHIKRLKINL